MWPQEYIELKHIEDLLVCGICYEVMDTSVITSCSHSYCSLCIRKYLHYKTQCPACFTETFEKDLRKNKILDEIITQFSQVKDKLKRCLQIQIQFGQVNENDNVCKTPKTLHRSKGTSTNNGETKVNANISVSENDASPCANVQHDISSPSTSGRPIIPLMFTPKSNKRPTVTNMEDTKDVICPVCKVGISELHINRHLDDCLKRESQKDRPQISDLKRKPLPKLVFSLMKDAVIRKKLKEFGLPTQGDRKALEARLQRYIVLYNAECDKSHPRLISELIKQCEEEENVEKKISKTSLLNKLQVTRNTQQNIIEDERKKYLKANKDSFETLIRKIKDMDSTKKSSARRSLLNESKESNEDIPQKRQAVCKTLDESVTEQNDFQSLNSDVYILDSDSDTSCPLQMYSSTEVNQFLNVGLSPSKTNRSQNKSDSETSYDGNVSREIMKTNFSPLKVNKIEKDDRSDALSDTSNSNKRTKSVMENSFHRGTPKHGSTNSKYKMLLERNEKISVKNEMKRRDSVTSSIKDFDCNSIFDEEEGEDERSSVSQEALRDFSSNACSDTKLNYGKLRPTDHGTLCSSAINSSNLEKENISCSPELSGNHTLRKRSRDSVQTDNKNITSSTTKKIKRSSQYLSGTKESYKQESASTLNGRDHECLQNKPRSRKRLVNVAEDTTAVRKSTRVKLKNNNH